MKSDIYCCNQRIYEYYITYRVIFWSSLPAALIAFFLPVKTLVQVYPEPLHKTLTILVFVWYVFNVLSVIVSRMGMSYYKDKMKPLPKTINHTSS